jgi:hypothetical protein
VERGGYITTSTTHSRVLSDVAVQESTDIVVTFDITSPRAYDEADCYQKDNLFRLSPRDGHFQLGNLGISPTDLRGRGEVKGKGKNFDAPAEDVR